MSQLLSHARKAFSRSSTQYSQVPGDEDATEKLTSAPYSDESNSSEHDRNPPETPPTRSRRKMDACTLLALFVCFIAIIASAFWVLARLAVDFSALKAQSPALSTAQVPSQDLKPAKDLKPSDPINKTLIIASYSQQDVSWAADIPSDWAIARYIMDDPNPYHAFTVPRNQGREAMAYLTFIIDNYHDLPDIMVFVHGHFRSWHQPEKVTSKVKALNVTALLEEGYFSLRCSTMPGCDPAGLNTLNPIANHDALVHMRDWWTTIFPPELGNSTFTDGGPRQTGELPEVLRGKCCAQFGVSRDAVHSMPLETWQRVRAPLLRDVDDFGGWGGGVSSHTLGLLYEPVWHILFGKPPQHCPPEDVCRKHFFSDAIRCEHYIMIGETEDDAHCHNIFDEPDAEIFQDSTAQAKPQEPSDSR